MRLVWALLFALSSVAPAIAVEPKGRPSSVIFVLVDTLRADYLGSYGFQGDISPNLDRIARESVVFEDCFSQAPWTKPSIATLFTSLDPLAHQVLSHRGQYNQPEVEVRTDGKIKTDVLPGSVTTLAEAFHHAGYATAGFVANPWIRQEVGFAQGFERFEDNFAANGTDADVIIDAARAWLEHRPKDKPFFLYLHFMDVHDPYDAPDADYEALKDSPSLGKPQTLNAGNLSKGLLRSLRPVGAHWADPDKPERLQLRTWRGRYAAGVRAFDRRFQVLLELLASSGLSRNTTLVITSDHGEELYEHGGWAHGLSLFDQELHVPLIIRPPGGLAGGKRVSGLVGLIDVAPTLTAFQGLTADRAWRGRNFSAALSGSSGRVEQSAIFATAVKWEPALAAVRTKSFKLMRDRSSGSEKLFDLTKDPAELRDVKAKNPAMTEKLRKLLADHLARTAKNTAARPKEVEIDKATTERLRALGYIE